MFAATGSTMNAAIVVREAAERRLERGEVVVRDDGRQRRDLVGDARAARDREGRDAGAGGHEEPVAVAVVAAVHLDDPLAPGRAPREPRADMVASVPELTNRTISTDGTIAATRSARRTSSSVGAPYDVPRRIARRARA
jgi:hypothetical protein